MSVKIGVIVPSPLRERLFSPADQDRLNKSGQVSWCEKALSEEEAVEFLRDCEIAIGSWGTPFPSQLIMDGCKKLRLWEHAAGTVKQMFGPHLAGRDLIIGSCAPGNAESVAEFTLGVMIMGIKCVFENAMANRSATAQQPPASKSLFMSTVGIIAASQVGRRVIKLLQPFAPRILLYDPYVSEAEAKKMGVELFTDLRKLCSECDIVSLHAPWLPSTERMMNARIFKAMKTHAIFINTARGACVDEDALITELEKGRLFAFLDVTYPEPTAEDSPLRYLPNVLLTSHIAGLADYKIGRNAVDDVKAFLNGGKPQMVVTEDMLNTIA